MNKNARKNGFTLVELLIAISLLSVIMLVTSSVFTVAIKSYRQNIQKSFFQKDMNVVLDGITTNLKSGSIIPAGYDTFTTSNNALVIGVPAINAQGNFIYTANVIENDYYVYYLENNRLHKKVYANPLGRITNQNLSDSIILKDVSSFGLTYSPSINVASAVKVQITLTRPSGRNDTTLTQSRKAGLRNRQ